MARSKKHGDAESRKRAKREAQAKYRKSEGGRIAQLRRKTNLRLDQIYIKILLENSCYAVHQYRWTSIRDLIPKDLNTLHTKFSGRKTLGTFNNGFQEGFKYLDNPTMHHWVVTHFLNVTFKDTKPHEVAYKLLEEGHFLSRIDGYFLSGLLDRLNRLYVQIYEKGSAERHEIMTQMMITRLWTLDGEVKKLNELWKDRKAIKGKRSKQLLKCKRYWMYQELTLIRYDLWQRFNHSTFFMVEQWADGRLFWQRCWRTSDDEVRSAIKGVWEKDVGHAVDVYGMFETDSDEEEQHKLTEEERVLELEYFMRESDGSCVE